MQPINPEDYPGITRSAVGVVPQKFPSLPGRDGFGFCIIPCAGHGFTQLWLCIDLIRPTFSGVTFERVCEPVREIHVELKQNVGRQDR